METRILFVALAVACIGGSDAGDSGVTADSGDGDSGATTDAACDAVWDVPFRSDQPVPCYSGTGDCYDCVRIEHDEYSFASGDVVDVMVGAVSCSGGAFEQDGARIATFDASTGILSVEGYGGAYVVDDVGACAWLQ